MYGFRFNSNFDANNIVKDKIALEKSKLNFKVNILQQICYEPNTHLTFLYKEIQAKIEGSPAFLTPVKKKHHNDKLQHGTGKRLPYKKT